MLPVVSTASTTSALGGVASRWSVWDVVDEEPAASVSDSEPGVSVSAAWLAVAPTVSRTTVAAAT